MLILSSGVIVMLVRLHSSFRSSGTMLSISTKENVTLNRSATTEAASHFVVIDVR